jgi:class 3 adenylate cyclase
VLHLAYESPLAAAEAAQRLRAKADEAPRIGGHYGLVEATKDPFGDGSLLMGAASALAPAILATTPPGGLQVSETFATALQAASAGARTEYVGTLPWDGGEQALYAIKAPA